MALLLPFVAAFIPRPAVSRMASVLRPVSMKHDGAQSSSVPCFESIQTKLEAGGLPGSIGTVGSRRSVLSVGAAATFGALWKGDRAFAAASDGNHIGEPVVSGGPLPLTVGLGTGPPYVQKDVELPASSTHVKALTCGMKSKGVCVYSDQCRYRCAVYTTCDAPIYKV